jgi:hypothetical protein
MVKSALSFHELAQSSKPTASHTFVTLLHEMGNLVRCYTQNIDQLHERAGLSTGLGTRCNACHSTELSTCYGAPLAAKLSSGQKIGRLALSLAKTFAALVARMLPVDLRPHHGDQAPLGGCGLI